MVSLPKPYPFRFAVGALLILVVLAGLIFALDPKSELARAAREKEAALGNEGVRARADLKEIGELAARAQRQAKATVIRITGSGCSDCACRTGDLRRIDAASPCMTAWLTVLRRLDAAAGSTGAEAKYGRDP